MTNGTSHESAVGHMLTLHYISTNWKKNRYSHDQLQVIHSCRGH